MASCCRVAVLLALVAGATGISVARNGEELRFVCGQQTTISVSTSADAAGTAQFSEVTMSDGVCFPSGQQDITAVKFCGPGSLTLSRMTCDRHDYKAHTVQHDKSAWTTNCETISVAGLVVDGHMGSMTLSC
mmetsp:Transcript_93268/g.246246  ORF Transcript_93268/g.246246 Transcript_93268/m.246246 type:complete len:132 (-) Transcript_93268:96-491(-)